MINANVAPVAGASLRSPSAPQQEKRPTVSAQQMSDLLRRYPDVTPTETLELVEFLKRGHPDTLAMVTYGSGLVSQASAVKKDHPEHFPPRWRLLLPWLALLIIPVLLIALARLL